MIIAWKEGEGEEEEEEEYLRLLSGRQKCLP